MFKQQTSEWKDAENNVDAAVVNKDESTSMRWTLQPVQPAVKIIVQPWSAYNSTVYAGQAHKLHRCTDNNNNDSNTKTRFHSAIERDFRGAGSRSNKHSENDWMN